VTWDDVKTAVSNFKGILKTEIEKIKAKAAGLLQKLKEQKDNFTNIVGGWVDSIKSSPMFQKIKEFSSCGAALTTLGSAGYKLVKLGLLIAKAISTAGASLIFDVPKMIITIICQWKEIKAAGKSFREAWTSTDVLEKYNKYGFFAGKMLSILISVLLGSIDTPTTPAAPSTPAPALPRTSTRSARKKNKARRIK